MLWKTIARICSVLLACAVMAILLPKWENKTQEKAQSEEEFCRLQRHVCLKSKTAKILRAIIGTVTFLDLAWLVFWQISDWIGVFYFFAMFGFCAFLFVSVVWLSFLFCEIVYDENGFTYTNAFGFNRRFSHAEVAAIQTTKKCVKVKMASKKLILPRTLLGLQAFLDCLNEKQASLQEDTCTPKRG